MTLEGSKRACAWCHMEKSEDKINIKLVSPPFVVPE